MRKAELVALDIETAITESLIKRKTADSEEPSLDPVNDLIQKSIEPLKKLLILKELDKGSSNEDLSLYTNIIDQLALEILEGVTEYEMYTEEVNAAQKELAYLEYAKEIVESDGSKEVAAKIQTAIDHLPSPELFKEDREIRKAFNSFREADIDAETSVERILNAISFCSKCKSILNQIAQKVGKSNPYYLEISRSIAKSALVTCYMETEFEDARPSQGVLRNSWELMEILEKFDFKQEFREEEYEKSREFVRKKWVRKKNKRAGCLLITIITLTLLFGILSGF